MKYNPTHIIEDYLLGKLDASEARALEQRAATDPQYARELQLQQDILTGITAFGDENMRAKIATVDQSLADEGFFGPDAETAAGQSGFWPRVQGHWKMFALLTAALAAGIWWIARRPSPAALPPSSSSSSAPVASGPVLQPDTHLPEAATPPVAEKSPVAARPVPPAGNRYLALAREAWSAPDVSQFRSGQTAGPNLLSQAAYAFQQGDYAAAKKLLAPLEPSDPNYWAASELYAHACFLSGDLGTATDRFHQIALSGQLPFSERAEWFLLLCYLADYPRAQAGFDSMLQHILTDEGHPYFEVAKGIARQIY